MDAIAAVLGCDDGALRRGDSEANDKATSLYRTMMRQDRQHI